MFSLEELRNAVARLSAGIRFRHGERLFYRVDNFCQAFEPRWQQQLLTHQLQTRQRSRQLCLSEIMTILIGFHQQGYRTFKDYYLKHVCCHWRAAFPGLVSYPRFVSWMPSVLLPLCAYLRSCFGSCSGISCLVNLVCGLIAYCHQPKKPSIAIDDNLLPAA